MEVEGGDALEQAERVQVLVNGQRRDLLGALDQGRTESELIHDRHPQRLHQGTRVLSKALLARDQCVPMVRVFLLPLLHIVCKSDIVMVSEQQAGSLSFPSLSTAGNRP